jgi:S1-C subfamily serine protease
VLPAIVTVIADLPARSDQSGQLRQTRNLGSGIVIDDGGYVVTNFHVIEGAESLSVVLATGEERPARLVGDDSPFTDMAVLQVPPQGLRFTPLADSAGARIGDPVYALAGSAIVGGNTVAAGIVSGTGRLWPRNGVVLEDLLQTDAAINHGDSGGALVNARGEVVGLLTTVVRESPNGLGIEGVSFAQSTDSIRRAVEEIIVRGQSSRPRIGIERLSQHVEVNPGLAAEQGLPVPFGALVTSVAPSSPAAGAGIVPGDIVIAVNGIEVDFETPLVNLLKLLRPGQPAELQLQRGDAQLTTSVVTRE